MLITKRNGNQEEFKPSKIKKAIFNAFESQNKLITEAELDSIISNITPDNVESIQNQIEVILMQMGFFDVAKAFIIYREKHKEARFYKERIDYMNSYSQSSENAATASETDANANVSMKNVANLEGEVYKTSNRVIQRQRMKDVLNVMYPEVSKQYEKDLEDHIIYTHDEATTPVLKPYCMAATLYPLMTEGVGNIDGVTPGPPNDIQSFSGQVTNLVFLLSSQCKGAVALGDYLIALNYYVIQEFGENWYTHINDQITNELSNKVSTIKNAVEKGMKQFIYGVNQPAGNRSFNSPFTNVSFYDSLYFESLFGEFYYPDGSKPKWEAIDCIQRIFMSLHRKLRLIKPLTFPVSTVAMVHDNSDIIDKSYKDLCCNEWALGSSHFCFINNSATSLASCCRVLNKIQDNTFSSTTGMTGVMTGSCNVITLNINRIVQDCAKKYSIIKNRFSKEKWYGCIKSELIDILERVYKYHIAFKTMLYDMEDKGMFAASNGGYIYIKKLYSTIGIIGYYEAAKFLGLETSNNKDYFEFLQLILKTIKDKNKEMSIYDKKRPFLFNTEAIPGEGLGVKFYNWDKKDGYEVPKDQNLYNCYFYNPWDNTSVLDKFVLHGKNVSSFTDGGQAAHINLDSHLSKNQYSLLIDFAIKNGTNYFTYNIPISECKDCGHVVNAPIKECPICKSSNIDWWTRVIGYLRPISVFSKDRQIEASKRTYTKENYVEIR